MLQIIVSIDAPAGLAQAVKEALASYLDLFGRSRVVEVNEILPQQLRLSCSGAICGIPPDAPESSSSKQSLRHDLFFPGKGQPTKICVQ